MICTYDEFSTNTPFNQIIKSTILLLLKANITNTRKKSLRNLLLFFSDVDEIDLRFVNWNQRYNRSNQTYAKYYSHMTQQQYGTNTLHSNNLYQIFTYVKNKEFELRNVEHTVSGMLLYAQTNEDIIPHNTYQMSGNQITVRALNLNQNFSGIADEFPCSVERDSDLLCLEILMSMRCILIIFLYHKR